MIHTLLTSGMDYLAYYYCDFIETGLFFNEIDDETYREFYECNSEYAEKQIHTYFKKMTSIDQPLLHFKKMTIISDDVDEVMWQFADKRLHHQTYECSGITWRDFMTGILMVKPVKQYYANLENEFIRIKKVVIQDCGAIIIYTKLLGIDAFVEDYNKKSK
jgi:hypothetical protein